MYTGGTNTTKFDENIPEMVVSFVKEGGEKVKDDHDGNYESLRVSHKCNEPVETVECVLLDGDAIIRATTAHTATENLQ